MTAFTGRAANRRPTGAPSTSYDGESSALARLWRGFMAARCFVALVLLLLQARGLCARAAAAARGDRAVAGYLAATVLGARFAPFHPPVRGFGIAWLSTIGVDLVTFTALQLLQAGTINYTPLFALPVLMGAVLGTEIVGLGTTAAATLLLLAHAGWHWLAQPGDGIAPLRAGRPDRHRPLRGRAARPRTGAPADARRGAGAAQPRHGADARAGQRPGDRDAQRRRAGDRRRKARCMRPTRRPTRSSARAWPTWRCRSRSAAAGLARRWPRWRAQTFARRAPQSRGDSGRAGPGRRRARCGCAPA